MIPREAVVLVRYVRACCPQQQIDELTPDAWQNLLGDLALDDCRLAVNTIAQRQPFVAPAEIRAEVRRIRNDRVTAAPIPDPATGDPAEYIRRLKTSTKSLADGAAQPAIASADTGDESWDNPDVRRIRKLFDAEQAMARARQAADQKAAREATRAYIDAQEALLRLDDLGQGALTTAFEDLFGKAQAALGFPLAADALGVTDQQKTVIHAARLTGGR